MLQIFKRWSEYYFADEEAVTILLMIALGLLLAVYATHITAPIIASLVIAYLLLGLQNKLRRYFPERMAFYTTYSIFIGLCLAIVFFVMPILGHQITAFAKELPKFVVNARTNLQELQQAYPSALSQEQMQNTMQLITEKAGEFGQSFVSVSFGSLGSVFTLMIYGVLIPLMVFFLLRDKHEIVAWLSRFLPKERPMMRVVWSEMNVQVANYARGKAVEIAVVGTSTMIAFAVFGLNYAVLLGFLVGLSVIIPYIGAMVVTIPVVLVSFFQFGYSDTFVYVFVVYAIIQFLDGNVLVPLLFSEAVNMHPLAIIISVLVFGGLWGMWGVFFAIPLATLIKALLGAWPQGLQLKEVVGGRGIDNA